MSQHPVRPAPTRTSPIRPARLASLSSIAVAAPGDAQAERRRRSRVAVLDAVRNSTGLVVIDVSAFGCCVRNAEAAIGPGHFIALQFATAGLIKGYVRWREEENIGVEFCREVSPDIERLLIASDRLEALRRL